MNQTNNKPPIVLFLFLICFSCGSQNQSSIVDIDASRLKELVETDVILLDVRTPDEYEKGRIEGAVLIDYRSADFKQAILALDSEKPVVVYCAAGGRSTGASKILKGAGFAKIYNYTGGFSDWKKRGESIAYE